MESDAELVSGVDQVAELAEQFAEFGVDVRAVLLPERLRLNDEPGDRRDDLGDDPLGELVDGGQQDVADLLLEVPDYDLESVQRCGRRRS